MAVLSLAAWGVEIPEEAVIEFPSGLIGLGGSAACCPQRRQRVRLAALPITEQCAGGDPFRFFDDFEVELSDEEAARIGLTEADDPTVYVTVRATDSLEGFSANLYAPILISGGRGHQVINQTADAPVRAPLFQRPATEERVHAA
jgi:flagellar assembly factor FliW